MRGKLIVLSCLLVIPGAPAPVGGQEPLSRVSLDDAVQLALRQNPTLRAQQAALNSTRAGEVIAALRPNPTATFLAEQFRLPDTSPQYTINIGQPIDLGGKQARDTVDYAYRRGGQSLLDFLDAQRS